MLMMGPQLQIAITSNAAALAAGTTAAVGNPTAGYFADIAEGTFQMGSTERDSEKPVHEVTLTGYQMGRTPVIVGEYRRFVRSLGENRFFLLGLSPQTGWPELLARGSSKEALSGIVLTELFPDVNLTVGRLSESSGAGVFPALQMVEITMPELPEAFSGDNHPMVIVNWFEAVTYALWHGARLATEAEYEHAARGGRNYKYGTADGKLTPELARYHPSDSTIAVGSFPANPFGLHDLAGNVWEWTMDWYGPYGADAVSDPIGPATGNYRVLRGGSWVSGPGHLRAAYRLISHLYFLPGSRVVGIGFRLVAALQGFPA